MSEINNSDSTYTDKYNKVDYRKKSFYTPADIVEKESRNPILQNLLLTWTGYYTKAYGHLVNNRMLQDYVIIYCVEGKGWLELNNRLWSIKKGDIFMCPPSVSHSYGADEKDPWTKYWLHFRGENAMSFMDLLGLSSFSPVLHIGENSRILNWLHEIFSIMETGYAQSNLLAATSYLGNILSYINSLMKNQAINKTENMTMEKVIAYMLDNMNVNLTLEQIANYAKISRYHFVRIFRDKTGYTPIDYYIRLKMQKACELLDSSTMKISSISSELGFTNPYYFSITFKRIVGQSPLLYREMINK